MSWTGGLWEALRDTESFFPRHFCSVSTAASNRSNS